MAALLPIISMVLSQSAALLAVEVEGTVPWVSSWMKDAALSVGFRVTGSQDLAARLRDNGQQADDLVVFDVCHAPTAAAVLRSAPQLSALLPCRIAVQGSKGRVWVRSIRPSSLAALLAAPESAQAAAREVDSKIDGILKEIRMRAEFEVAWAATARPYREALLATKSGRPEAAGLIQASEAKWAAMPPAPAFYSNLWPSIRRETAEAFAAAKKLPSGASAHEALEGVRVRWAERRAALGYTPYEDLLTRFHDAMEAATEAGRDDPKMAQAWNDAMGAPRLNHPKEAERSKAQAEVEATLAAFRANPGDREFGKALRSAFARFFVPFG